MERQSGRRYRAPVCPEMDDTERKRLVRVLGIVNEEAGKVRRIVISGGGDQVLGDRQVAASLGRIEEMSKVEVFRGGSLAKLLDQGAWNDLELLGYRLLQSGRPVPWLQLVRCVYTRSHGVAAIVERVAGSPEAAERVDPLAPRLLVDGWRRRYVDAADLEAEMAGEAGNWVRYDFLDELARVSLDLHHFAERVSFRAVLLAGRLGLKNILALVGYKVLSDHLRHGRKEGRYRRDDGGLRRARRHATALPDPVLVESLASVGASAHRRIEERVLAEVVRPFVERAGARRPSGGLLAFRSLESVTLGMSGCPSSSGENPVPGDLLELEERAGRLLPEVEGILREGSGEGKERSVLPIVPADLESRAPVRQIMAAGQVAKAFFRFLEESGLAQRYEREAGREIETAPLPSFDPGFPVDLRLFASVTARLYNDFKDLLRLPDWLSAYVPDPAIDEEGNKAHQGMWAELLAVVNRRIVFGHLLEAPGMERLAEGWLTLHEARFSYLGCGVGSVTGLLFPALFFSDDRFAALLRGEREAFREAWMEVRRTALPLGDILASREWGRLRNLLDAVMRVLKELRLAFGCSNVNATGGLPLAPLPDPFAPPPVVDRGGGDVVHVQGVAAPIRSCKAPPGNAGRYRSMVDRSQRFIRLLRRIDARAVAPKTSFRRHCRSGPVLDDLKVADSLHSEEIFSTVRYTPALVPHGREQVVILFDFSGSMGPDKVAIAKDAAVILAEGLRERFDVRLLLYHVPQQFYDLVTLFDSADRKLAGNAALASICAPGLDHGSGGNPDAGILLGLLAANRKEGGRPFTLIHLSDHEWCPSLSVPGIAGAAAEMRYAVTKLVGEGHRYAAARVGKDEDPFSGTDVPHDYIHFGADGLTGEKVKRLYRIVAGDAGRNG